MFYSSPPTIGNASTDEIIPRYASGLSILILSRFNNVASLWTQKYSKGVGLIVTTIMHGHMGRHYYEHPTTKAECIVTSLHTCPGVSTGSYQLERRDTILQIPNHDRSFYVARNRHGLKRLFASYLTKLQIGTCVTTSARTTRSLTLAKPHADIGTCAPDVQLGIRNEGACQIEKFPSHQSAIRQVSFNMRNMHNREEPYMLRLVVEL